MSEQKKDLNEAISPDGRSTSPLCSTSLYVGLVGIALWIIISIGLVWTNSQHPSVRETYLIATGLLMLLAFGLNIIGLTVGIIALFLQSPRDSRAIIGTTINGVCILVATTVIVLGLTLTGKETEKQSQVEELTRLDCYRCQQIFQG